MHVWSPALQLLVHESAHWAEGGKPEHDSGLAHIAVEPTYKQPSPSMTQVATVCMSSHAVPASAQSVASHAHAAEPPAIVQVWCVPHVCVGTH
jgi:hypothetical protein